MKNTTKIISLIPLLSILLVCTTCEKEEDYNAITYYDAVGIGYVFMYDSVGSTMSPVQGAKITVTTGLGYGGGFLTPPLPEETFITDANGKYQVRFIKRTHRRDATLYTIELESSYNCFDVSQFTPDDVVNAPNNTYSIPDYRVRYTKKLLTLK